MFWVNGYPDVASLIPICRQTSARPDGIALLEGKQNLLLGELGLLHRFLSLPYKDAESTLLQF